MILGVFFKITEELNGIMAVKKMMHPACKKIDTFNSCEIQYITYK